MCLLHKLWCLCSSLSLSLLLLLLLLADEEEDGPYLLKQYARSSEPNKLKLFCAVLSLWSHAESWKSIIYGTHQMHKYWMRILNLYPYFFSPLFLWLTTAQPALGSPTSSQRLMLISLCAPLLTRMRRQFVDNIHTSRERISLQTTACVNHTSLKGSGLAWGVERQLNE